MTLVCVTSVLDKVVYSLCCTFFLNYYFRVTVCLGFILCLQLTIPVDSSIS